MLQHGFQVYGPSEEEDSQGSKSLREKKSMKLLIINT